MENWHLPSILLLAAWFSVLRAARYSGWRIALLSLVGTTGHELCHAAVGWVLGAKPTSFSLLPRREGNVWVLGSVGFRNLTLWNAAPVAFAPLLLAGLAWLIFQFWTVPAFEAEAYVAWLLSGYVLATCLFSCMPSWTDLKIGGLSGLLYGGLGYVGWQLATG